MRGLRFASPVFASALVAVLVAGCAGLEVLSPPSSGQSAPAPAPTAGRAAPADQPAPPRPADRRDVERLSRVMVPLVKAADHPQPVDRIRVGIVNDPSINAGSAGGGQYIVTRGLLDRANDEQLTAVLAHEVAHDDLGHVGKQQALGTGLELGAAILDQIFPGTGQVAPLAGNLILRAYSRSEELEADRHGVDLLRRVGARPDAMERALLWLAQVSGSQKGGFFSTHPGTDERLAALRRLK
jgi:Zn-dependent protease with chaperone function